MSIVSLDSCRQYFSELNPQYIDWKFYEPYLGKEPPYGELGVIVFLRTYSRFVPSLERREKLAECCLRVVEYSLSLDNVSTIEQKKAEAEQLFDCLFNFRGFASGRAYWMAGTEQSRKCGSAAWNCVFRAIDDVSAFSEVFYWLLLGAGVGFSVENKYITHLPTFYANTTIHHKNYEFNESRFPHTQIYPQFKGVRSYVDRYTLIIEDLIDTDGNFLKDWGFDDEQDFEIVVGDSKEGWCNAVRLLMHLMTQPNTISITFNYDNVRPKGERIKTFGGRASGHQNIQETLERVYTIISSSDGKLNSVNVLDILNSIGLGVVSGGVRRTAQIALGDKSDIAFIEAKENLWTDEAKTSFRSTRVMSNNSVVYYENPGLEDIRQVVSQIKTNGEPGFSLVGNAQKYDANIAGFNPCLTGDMRLLTAHGYIALAEMEDQEVEIINAEGNVAKSQIWSSGIKETVAMRLSDKRLIKATPDHLFMTLEGESEAKDCKGKQLLPFLQKPRHDNQFLSLGFMQGDGTLSRQNSPDHTGIEVNIGKNDIDVLPIFELYKWNWNGERVIYVQGVQEQLKELGFSQSTLVDRTLPSTYSDWHIVHKAAFLSGCYSANGSVLMAGRITYKSICHTLIEQLQETLEVDFGIHSYITTNKSKLVEFANGVYRCKESYDLNIACYEDRQRFFNLIGFIQSYKTQKLAQALLRDAPTVISVKPNGIEKVYDFSEPLIHWGVIEGFVAHNCHEAALANKQSCNLTTQNLVAHIQDGKLNYSLLEQTLRLITRIGCRQTLGNQWHPDWDAVQKRDRLLGVSMTGVEDAFDILNWKNEEKTQFYQWAADVVRNEADQYNSHLGIPRSARVTLVKPEGTLSQLPTVSSGIGKAYAPYYLRRVRFSRLDPLAIALLKLGVPVIPENNQGDDLFAEQCNTWVFTFPIKTNAKIRAIDEPLESQFDRYLRVQKYYVRDGHNASNTMTVAPHEWDTVVELVDKHWDDIIGITFLPRFDPREGGSAAYPNMPYEPCEKHEYDELFASLPQLTENQLIDILAKHEQTEEEQSLDDSCATGACPVR